MIIFESKQENIEELVTKHKRTIIIRYEKKNMTSRRIIMCGAKVNIFAKEDLVLLSSFYDHTQVYILILMYT